MLESSQRMNRGRFEEVFCKSSVFHSSHFITRISKKSTKPNQGSVVVSKKVSKSAVLRHRLRRRVYAIITDIFKDAPTPFDVIVITKRGAQALQFAEIKAELEEIFRKVPS